MNAAIANSLAAAAVVVRRTIAAPPEDIFDAWLDPQALAEWMRPGTIRSTVATVEPRVGGRYQILMHGESGEIPHSGVYRVIDRPKRLVFTWQSPHSGPEETLVTVEFLKSGKATEVVVTHEKLPESARAAHSRGWTSGLEHLDQACGHPGDFHA
jgi:uncharacterized protein YndB with AHSA1/START domain